jgi:hypothetical protein
VTHQGEEEDPEPSYYYGKRQERKFGTGLSSNNPTLLQDEGTNDTMFSTRRSDLKVAAETGEKINNIGSYKNVFRALEALAGDNGGAVNTEYEIPNGKVKAFAIADKVLSKLDRDDFMQVVAGDYDKTQKILNGFGRDGRTTDKLLEALFQGNLSDSINYD